MNQSVNTELSLFCPCQECNFYQKKDNKITKDGSYKTKSDETLRQRYYCHGGKHRIEETRYSDLFQKIGGRYVLKNMKWLPKWLVMAYLKLKLQMS